MRSIVKIVSLSGLIASMEGFRIDLGIGDYGGVIPYFFG